MKLINKSKHVIIIKGKCISPDESIPVAYDYVKKGSIAALVRSGELIVDTNEEDAAEAHRRAVAEAKALLEAEYAEKGIPLTQTTYADEGVAVTATEAETDQNAVKNTRGKKAKKSE